MSETASTAGPRCTCSMLAASIGWGWGRETGGPVRKYAEAIGRGLKLPTMSLFADRAGEHFGALGLFAGLDLVASSALTQKQLDWRPTQTGLLDDLDHARDFEPENAKTQEGRYAASK